MEEEPSVINAIKDRFIRPLKWNWLLSLSCKRECGCWPGGDGILRPDSREIFFLLLFIGGVTAPHSISSTGAFLLRRPYSVPFSILRKRLKPKVHPKFSRSHEYSTVFASIRGVIRMNIPLEQNACMQEFHMCNVCRQTLIIYDLLTIAKRNRSILI